MSGLSDKDKALAFDLIKLILEVGAPAAIRAIRQFEFDHDPTPEQISALSDMLKNPEEYFKCGGQS